MSARPTSSEDTPALRPARRNRHRVPAATPAPVPPAAPAAPAAPPAEQPAPPAPRRIAPVAAGAGLYAETPGGVSRPAQLSDRCMGCGAPTRGRANMVTEVVQSGPVRALRVVACSACPDRRSPAPAGGGAAA
jgi:hypothetical protein